METPMYRSLARLTLALPLLLACQPTDTVDDGPDAVAANLETEPPTGNWPRAVGPTSASGVGVGAPHAPLPARTADGQTWFVLCGYINQQGTTCSATHATGVTARTFAVATGTLSPPSAGNVDGQPGDEVIIPDDRVIHILSPDLTLRRDIPIPQNQTLIHYETMLADLDNDGAMEIVTLAFNLGWGGTLHAYRGDGTPFSPRFPLLLDRPDMPDGFIRLEVVAPDLNGDGVKEIVVLMVNQGSTHYLLPAFTATGEPLPGWSTPDVPLNGYAGELKAGDLERDGRPELFLFEQLGIDDQQLRVLDSRGVTRPGFPVRGPSFMQALADLDGDGIDEIITRGGDFMVLRADGTRFGAQPWPVAPYHGPALVADVNGDATPEIVVSDVRFDLPPEESGPFLKAISATGVLVRRWSLPAVGGQMSWPGAPAIGDFDGNGRNDIAVHYPIGSGVTEGALAVFNTEIAGSLDWPMPYADPQNSSFRSLPARPTTPPPPPPPPDRTLVPVADAYIRDGALARTNFGREPTLLVKRALLPSQSHVTFLRFSLADVPADVASAKLRLYGKRQVASPVTDSAFAVADNSWTERGLTWRNSPALGARQGSGTMVPSTAGYVEWDVTTFVRSQKTARKALVSLAVRMDALVGNTLDTFNSREAITNQPQLVVSGR
jgi:hypothetical protein